MPISQIPAEAIFPFPEFPFVQFPSRRSVVHSANGMVACSQPLAAEAGQRILRSGGNAADAAVAVAAALNVTEPCSTGIGGDMFCLYWNAKTKQIHALNGSGRSPKNSTIEQVRKELGVSKNTDAEIPNLSALSVTVPGAAAGWVDTVERFGSGKLTMEQILTPAIELAEDGFPVSEITAYWWKMGEQMLRDASPNFREMMKRDRSAEHFARAPRVGEIMRMPTMAKTFRTLATEGKKGFYGGRIGKAIIDVLKMTGSFMEQSDLDDHLNRGTEETTPISLKFSGQNVARAGHPAAYESPDPKRFVELWEHAPNGQGIVALMALGIFEELERTNQIPPFTAEDHNSITYLHAIIECLRIAFADGHWWISDPEHRKATAHELLSKPYLASRAKLFDKSQAATKLHVAGAPSDKQFKSPALTSSDTVYFCVADRDGNAMSFINSNYDQFGSYIIPQGCGFTLQNRGSGFRLSPSDHPNIYAGGKRPYHTIIPGLVTHGDGDERELHSVLGVMGGYMQPQGHVQVLLNMEVFGLNPQQALDAPRICLGTGAKLDPMSGMTGMSPDKDVEVVYLEEGIDEKVVAGLRKLGHDVEIVKDRARSQFGKGQIIRRHVDQESGKQVWSGGSDMRGDGCAMPA